MIVSNKAQLRIAVTDHDDDRADDARECSGRLLHELLFPLGPRQSAALKKVSQDTSARETLRAIHAGVGDAIAELARTAGAQASVQEWLSLEDSPRARSMFAATDPRDEVVRCTERAFLAAYEQLRSVGDAYQTVLGPELRHRLGEYYTPREVVNRIVESLPMGSTVADPACGDGRFIVSLLAHGWPAETLWAMDLNPLAVMMARFEAWAAAGRPDAPPVQIAWGDFVLPRHGTSYPGHRVLSEAVRTVGTLPEVDCFVGNPPWVTWRNISEPYRRALAESWEASSLNHARGWAARVSAGQTDLAHLFIHEAVERVRPLGRIAFVLPISTFKAPCGPLRIREGVTSNARVFSCVHVLDYEGTDVFAEVRTPTVVVFIEADKAQSYPVRWDTVEADLRTVTAGEARLSDPSRPGSPWLTGEGLDERPLREDARAQYRARGGVNTGGANGVFHVDVVSRTAGSVVVRNRVSTKMRLPQLTAQVEQEFLRPLLRGRDISPWRASASGHILLPHVESDLRRVVPEEQLAAEAPLTLSYLKSFKQTLSGRRELDRWGGTWYTLFRIGPYTANCWRVVWPHSGGRQFRAAVLTNDDRTIPDQKVVLVALDDPESAYFLCGVLNSSRVRSWIHASGGLDTSPNLLQRVPLPKWNPEIHPHRALMEHARRACSGRESAQELLDDLVDAVWESAITGVSVSGLSPSTHNGRPPIK